ncbi:MAG: hypothetical protein M1835_007168 [Candelina submexicana]|nr:MAG: hypothetical protein M1835_007168 [Candelina submexicana]
MPPPPRSPGAHNTATHSSISSTREAYKTSTPHTNRHTLSPRTFAQPLTKSPQSPLHTASRSSESRGIAVTPSSSTLGNQSLQLDAATQLKFGTVNEGPPLEETTIIHQITTGDGQKVRPEISARIDKGFFLAEQNWTCYRRNYFSVACAYSVQPPLLTVPLYLDRGGGSSALTENIRAFAMSISAVVDGPGGKPIDLVQHTPKRDKGPQGRPDRVKLLPQPSGSGGPFSAGAVSSNPLASRSQIPGQQDYDSSFSPQNAQQQTIANFERIQFKSATANNGKRRAAQQYYHLVVELFADIGNSVGSPDSDTRWVKIATRISAPMVVRGRSPGHYQDDRRASSSSTGPGGGSGASGGGGDKPGGHLGSSSSGRPSGTRSMGIALLGGSSNTSSNGGSYHSRSSLSHSVGSSRYDSHSHPSSSNSSSIGSGMEHPSDSIPPSEDVDHFPSYQYFPQPVFDMQPNSFRLPSFKAHPYKQEVSTSIPPTPSESLRKHERYFEAEEPRRVFKEEYPGGGGLQLPGLGTSWHPGAANHRRANMLGNSCGRLQVSAPPNSNFPELPFF